MEGLECWLLEQIGRHVEYGITSMMIQDQTPGERAGLKNVAILSALGRTVKRMFPDLSLGIILEANNPSAGNVHCKWPAARTLSGKKCLSGP